MAHQTNTARMAGEAAALPSDKARVVMGIPPQVGDSEALVHAHALLSEIVADQRGTTGSQRG